MIKTRKSLLLLLPLFLMFSCYKDSDNTPDPTVINSVSPVFVNTIINGHLWDLNGDLISNYTLIINNEHFEVENSYFSFQVEGVNKKGQVVYVEKDGKIIALQTFLPIENDINRFEFIVFPSWTANKVNPNESGLFSINQDVSIDFSGGRFYDNQGEVSDPSFIQSGMFSDQNKPTGFGFNALGALTALEVLGGFYLDFENDFGEILTVDTERPINLVLQNVIEHANALYWLDAKNETWIEIGKEENGSIETSIKNGGYFIITKAVKAIFVEGQSTKQGFPIAYQKYTWEIDGVSGSHIGSESGTWFTVLPQQSNVEFNLINPCGEQVQNQTISTKSTDLEGENITVDKSDKSYQFLTTKVVNCYGETENIQTIHLKIAVGNGQTYTFKNDNIMAWFPVCSPFTISAYNIKTDTEGPSLEWSNDITDELSYLTNCENFTDGFTYLRIGDETKLFPPFILETNEGQSLLRSPNNTIRLVIKGMEEGVFDEDQVNIYIKDPDFGSKGYYISCENSTLGCGISDCFISHYDLNPGGLVRISFSGKLWMRTIEPIIAGNYDLEGVIYIKN